MNWFLRIFYGENDPHPIFNDMYFQQDRLWQKKRREFLNEKIKSSKLSLDQAQKIYNANNASDDLSANLIYCKLINVIYNKCQSSSVLHEILDFSYVESGSIREILSFVPTGYSPYGNMWHAFLVKINANESVRLTIPAIYGSEFSDKMNARHTRYWESKGRELNAAKEHDGPILSRIEEFRSKIREKNQLYSQSRDQGEKIRIIYSIESDQQMISRLKEGLKVPIAELDIEKIR